MDHHKPISSGVLENCQIGAVEQTVLRAYSSKVFFLLSFLNWWLFIIFLLLFWKKHLKNIHLSSHLKTKKKSLA